MGSSFDPGNHLQEPVPSAGGKHGKDEDHAAEGYQVWGKGVGIPHACPVTFEQAEYPRGHPAARTWEAGRGIESAAVHMKAECAQGEMDAYTCEQDPADDGIVSQRLQHAVEPGSRAWEYWGMFLHAGAKMVMEMGCVKFSSGRE